VGKPDGAPGVSARNIHDLAGPFRNSELSGSGELLRRDGNGLRIVDAIILLISFILQRLSAIACNLDEGC
jgi:hypothetical protein